VTALSYVILSIIWMMLLARPLFLNDFPLWLVVTAACSHFLCLLGHEAGHALGAARYGIQGGGIAIFLPFGTTSLPGVDRIRRFPPKRAVILGGSLTSFALGVGSGALGLALAGGSASGLCRILSGALKGSTLREVGGSTVLLYFAYANLCRVVVEYLPFGKLDGPMLLRWYCESEVTSWYAFKRLTAVLKAGARLSLAILIALLIAAILREDFHLGVAEVGAIVALCAALWIYPIALRFVADDDDRADEIW